MLRLWQERHSKAERDALEVGSSDRGRPEVYAPSIWRWIMLAIRNLPRLVMRRIEF